MESVFIFGVGGAEAFVQLQRVTSSLDPGVGGSVSATEISRTETIGDFCSSVESDDVYVVVECLAVFGAIDVWRNFDDLYDLVDLCVAVDCLHVDRPFMWIFSGF